jgi:hypothetical protein
MRAYNLAMMMIFVNCGFGLVAAFGVFPLSGYTGVFSSLVTVLTNPLVIGTLALTMAAGTTLLASTVMTDRGTAYITFSTIYWGAFGTASLVFIPLSDYPGFEIFYTIYTMATFLIFLMGIVQMPLGGVKGHV